VAELANLMIVDRSLETPILRSKEHLFCNKLVTRSAKPAVSGWGLSKKKAHSRSLRKWAVTFGIMECVKPISNTSRKSKQVIG